MAPATITWCKLMLDNPGDRVFRAWVGVAQRQAALALWPMRYGGDNRAASQPPSPFPESDARVAPTAIVSVFPTLPKRLEQAPQHVATGE
jgi:hypothetical protein